MKILSRLFKRRKAVKSNEETCKVYFLPAFPDQYQSKSESYRSQEVFREHAPGDGPKFCPTGMGEEVVYRASTPPYFYTMPNH